MRIALPTLLLSSVLLLAPGLSFAGEGCMGAGADTAVSHIFDSADADGSGTLTPTEYAGAGLESFGVSFADADLDGNGETSKAEYFELYDAHHSTGERVSL